MRLKKRLNNNVVLAENHGHDCILFGKGIGFKAYPGDDIDEEIIEQKFIPSDNFDVYTIGNLLCDASPEDVKMTRDIIKLGKRELGKELNENLLFTLLDHLTFALKRSDEDMELSNPIEWEVKNMYRKETLIGAKALDIVEHYKHVRLPKSEIAFIALHFVNAQFEKETMEDTLELTGLMNEINTIIKYSFQIDLDPDSMNYQRFCTHLRYYLIRQKNHDSLDMGNEELYYIIKERYPKESDCVDKITNFIEQEYGYPTLADEKLYLILHVNRLIH